MAIKKHQRLISDGFSNERLLKSEKENDERTLKRLNALALDQKRIMPEMSAILENQTNSVSEIEIER